MAAPAADRPQYADGTPVPDFIDSSTRQWSRGLDPVGGRKGVEPAERRPVVTPTIPLHFDFETGVASFGGTDFGGSTGATLAGTAVTGFSVLSEEEVAFVAPGYDVEGFVLSTPRALIVLNPAGDSVSVDVSLVNT